MAPGIPIAQWAAWWGGAATIGVAWLLGLALLSLLAGRAARRLAPVDALALALACGLPAAAALVLAIGQAQGALFAFPWGCLGVAGWLAAAVFLKFRVPGFKFQVPNFEFHAGPTPESRRVGIGSCDDAMVERAVGWIGWSLLALVLGFLIFPAFCPPSSYDVLEYHLGIVPHVFETGRVRPIPHVFYTAQPIATEMLYTLGAVVEGLPRGQAPGVFQWALIVLGVTLSIRAARRLDIAATWRPWLALWLITHPITLPSMLDRFTDWTGVVMLTAGLLVWTIGRAESRMTIDESGLRITDSNGNPQSPIPNPQSIGPGRTAMLMGLCAGGAVAAKWTHAGTVALPLALLATQMSWQGGGAMAARVRRAAVGLALFGGIAALALLPWLTWLWVTRGNPFAPFLAGLFPTSDWPPDRLAYLIASHGGILRPWQAAFWVNLAVGLAAQIAGTWLIGLVILGALVVWLLDRRSSRPASARETSGSALAWVIAGLVAGVLTWGGLRLAAARFLAPIVLMALLALTLELRALLGASPSSASLGRRLGVALLATAGLMGLWGVLRSDSIRALLADMARSATGRQSLSDYRSLMLGSTSELPAATEALPPSARLVAINEARRYLIHRPVELASVFDASPLRPAIAGAADGESIRRQLVIAGFTHLLVNDFERVRILNVHPPPALQGDARLTQLLALTHETPAGDAARHWAEAQLLDDYWGHTEFALDPLTNDERRAYGEFLSLMRRRALEVAAWPGQTSPAIWIAPLE